ncbi:transposase family protein [Streptomyces mirabilis]|uniref:transposase family protein n=1 Tax=Streptomyces mirabilis TaxID=68239 RepID=UPI0036DAEC92
MIPTWRCAGLATQAGPAPLYSGKHHDHGANVQALTTTSGELLFLGAARPGSTHDLTAARADGVAQAVTDVETTANSGYQDAVGTVRTPIKRPKGRGHNGWERQANSAFARLRALPSAPSPNSGAGGCSTVADRPEPQYRRAPRPPRDHTKAIFTRKRVDRKRSVQAPR